MPGFLLPLNEHERLHISEELTVDIRKNTQGPEGWTPESHLRVGLVGATDSVVGLIVVGGPN